MGPLNGTTLGRTAITARGFFPYAYWYWIAIGATVGFTIIFNITFALSLEFLNPFEKVQASVPAKEDDDVGAVELATRPESEDGSNQSTKKGMILPFEPHSITFDDVTYSVDMPPLFLMKRGGQEIYVGPVGRQSCELINYFEGIKRVSKIKDGYNPATWMLEASSSAQELALGVDFNEIYKDSDLFK
ncbi:hypothetical protein L1887_03749 [Cichorium endivia]|nr:hypothetical protein L1887_03749 [Cichorium endivia]